MFENLSKEILEKVKQAKSKEEALNILKENGITLTDEDLAGIAGGDGENCTIDLPCFLDKVCTGIRFADAPFCGLDCPLHNLCPDQCVANCPINVIE